MSVMPIYTYLYFCTQRTMLFFFSYTKKNSWYKIVNVLFRLPAKWDTLVRTSSMSAIWRSCAALVEWPAKTLPTFEALHNSPQTQVTYYTDRTSYVARLSLGPSLHLLCQTNSSKNNITLHVEEDRNFLSWFALRLFHDKLYASITFKVYNVIVYILLRLCTVYRKALDTKTPYIQGVTDFSVQTFFSKILKSNPHRFTFVYKL